METGVGYDVKESDCVRPLQRVLGNLVLTSTSLAQWFNKYHAGLEVIGSIPMGDFHI